MDAEKANYEVTRMARLLGVTRQGYYAWRKQRQTGPGPRAQRRTEIDQAVRNAFHASDEVYGAPRIARGLAIGAVAVDRKTGAAPTLGRSRAGAWAAGTTRCGADQRHLLRPLRRGVALPGCGPRRALPARAGLGDGRAPRRGLGGPGAAHGPHSARDRASRSRLPR